jgi:hypothetical protein
MTECTRRHLSSADPHGVMLHPETRMVGFPSFDDAVGAAT